MTRSNQTVLLPPKITPPRESTAGVERRRLFDLLDRAGGKPVTWIVAPAGSGKTTLAAHYLASRQLPKIWYQCDDGDADPAAFFYYMGLAAQRAAPGRENPLPMLTPEYLAGISTFSGRYFAALYDCLLRILEKSPTGTQFVIVLDDYHEVPAGALLHKALIKGVTGVPPGIRFLVLSRGEPPAAFARIRAGGALALIDPDALRFTPDEFGMLMRSLAPALDRQKMDRIHRQAEGWIAGMILMLEQRLLGGTETPERGLSRSRIFDYFASEVFDKTDGPVRGFLLKTAILSTIEVAQAEALTGVENAGSILSELNRHCLFTEELSSAVQSYRYHPLFREFLLSRAAREFPPEALSALRCGAAKLLEASGRTEEAAHLFRQAGEYDSLAGMIKRCGRALILQGRNRTLENWFSCLPGEIADRDPWLSYWRGMCAIPADMAGAAKFLEKALDTFRSLGESDGIYLSWAGIVDVHVFGLDAWRRLDDAIALFETLTKEWPDFSSREIEFTAASRMLMALTLRKTDEPRRVQAWLERVSALLRECPSNDIQMDTLFFISIYHLWKGEYDKNAVLLERAEAEVRLRPPSPFNEIGIKLMAGIHCWVTARYDDAREHLAQGLAVSKNSGFKVYDSLMWGFTAASQMASGHSKEASTSLKRQMATLIGKDRALDLYFYHVNAAWHALLENTPALALEHLNIGAALVDRMGTPYYEALWHIGMSQASFLLGHAGEAETHVRAAQRIGLAMKSRVVQWYGFLLEAWILLQAGKKTDGLRALRRGLALGRRYGYLHLEFYLPVVMRYLFATALAERIEPAYVQTVIRKLGLTPPQPPDMPPAACFVSAWPYPVRITTLGRFEIQRDDTPLVFSGKAQKKPLELLKVLIASGGREVADALLCDVLWPDSDGDRAHKSFETTLARLRKLLGGNDLFVYNARQLSFNPSFLWVDSMALEQLFDATQDISGEASVLQCRKALDLYTGAFLPGDDAFWALSFRETLKERLLHLILTAGSHLRRIGKEELCVELYTRALDADPLAEAFYRRLMACQQRLGNHAEAVKTYHRCRDLLKAELGIAPSPETTAVYTAIAGRR
jgi:DNA-binding SARP family transcriptional activator